MTVSRHSLFLATLCLSLSMAVPAQQSVADGSAHASSNPPSQGSSPVEFALVRQGPSFQGRLMHRPQKALELSLPADAARAWHGSFRR